MLGKPRIDSCLDLVSDGLAFGMWTPKHVLLRLITLVAQVADLGTGWVIPVDPVVGGQSPVEELDNVNPVGESFPGAQSIVFSFVFLKRQRGKLGNSNAARQKHKNPEFYFYTTYYWLL